MAVRHQDKGREVSTRVSSWRRSLTSEQGLASVVSRGMEVTYPGVRSKFEMKRKEGMYTIPSEGRASDRPAVSLQELQDGVGNPLQKLGFSLGPYS